MYDHWVSVNETAAKFKIPDPSTILAWRRAVETEGMEALLPKKKGRPPMTKDRKKNKPVNQSHESLIEEVERLRMENAYLKKLNALVREQEKLPRNSKRR
jgi:transposase-like protein